MKKKGIGIVWLLILIAFDQITKIIAKSNLEGTMGHSVIKDVFQFQYHENRGMAFGLLQNKIWLFVIFTIIILIVLGYIYFKLPDSKKYNAIHWILIFLSAGALGNFIDRVFRNYVVDFLYFELIDFPIFNVADMYVTVSCFILVILLLFYYKDDDFHFLEKKGNIN